MARLTLSRLSVASFFFFVALSSTSSSAAAATAAAKPPTSANGTHTVKGELNAFLNTALSLPPSYLPGTRISSSLPPDAAATSSSSSAASSSLECFKRCAVSINTNVSLSCYGATFAPATSTCTLFAKASTSAAPSACPSLVLEADPAAHSELHPFRYSTVAESCITSGPLFKDGPPFEVPTPREGADAAAGIATEALSAAVLQGTTVARPLPSSTATAAATTTTTLSYLGTVGNMVSPAVCTGICQRYKSGANWTAEPTAFAGTWAAAAGLSGVPTGVVARECVASSHYEAAAVFQQTDDRFEYVCDLWGAPRAPGVLAVAEFRPQEPGGRNAASVLILPRWKRLPRS